MLAEKLDRLVKKQAALFYRDSNAGQKCFFVETTRIDQEVEEKYGIPDLGSQHAFRGLFGGIGGNISLAIKCLDSPKKARGLGMAHSALLKVKQLILDPRHDNTRNRIVRQLEEKYTEIDINDLRALLLKLKRFAQRDITAVMNDIVNDPKSDFVTAEKLAR